MIFFGDFAQAVGVWVFGLVYLVAPFFLFIIAWHLWVKYVQLCNIKKQEWVLLDIKIPKNLSRSPEAMEVVLSTFHQPGDGTFFKRYWHGAVQTWFSLEIASLAGEVHFYIYTQKFFKNLIESRIYSEYPMVEIYEVDDYAWSFPYGQSDSDWDLWGCHFKLEKPDPYPIKTYVDYNLGSRDGVKEEEKIDPIAPMLETMGSIGPGEQLWFQMIIRAAKKRFKKKNKWFEKADWKEEGQNLLKSLLKRDLGKDASPSETNLSSGEKLVAEAVERNISKLGFDCGIRGMYLAKKDNFDQSNVVALISMLKQFNSLNLNGFKPANTTSLKYSWQDWKNWRLNKIKWGMYDAYRRREYFNPPYQYTPITLNTEELATIYHFPGEVIQTPTLSRIASKRGEPPVNLPI